MSVTEPVTPSPSTQLGDVAELMIRSRIMHTLWIYPHLSPSMLQIGIGTGFPSDLWHPVLERLIEEGTVVKRQVRATNPVTHREQVYTIIEAAPTEAAPTLQPTA